MSNPTQALLESITGLTGSAQAVVNQALGFSRNQYPLQAALNLAAGRSANALTTEEALYENISQHISLDGTYYTEQDLLQLAVDNGLDIFQVSGFDPGTGLDWYASYLAEDNSAVGNGNEVTTWADASGNARHLTATAGNKPIYTAVGSGLNNQAVIDFSSTDFMQSLEATFGNLSAPCSVVVVGRNASRATGTNQIFVDSANVSKRLILRAGSNNTWQFVQGVNLQAGGTPDELKHFFAGYGNGANSTFQVDNAISTGSVGTGSQGYQGLTLGARYDGGAPTPFNFGFVGIYNGNIFTDPLWPVVKKWVTSKYVITTG